jgi:hypothetical protein
MLKDETFSSNHGNSTKLKNSSKSLSDNQRRYSHD